MSNLVLHVQGLDSCRFYIENMLHTQFGNPLLPVPATAPDNEPINDRVLHRLINDIDMAFEHAVSRTDLKFPIAGILYRFRSLYGNYASQYNDERTYSGSPSSIGKPNTRNRPIEVSPVPEQGADEDDRAFSYRFIKHTAEQVQSYIWMVCLDQYAREQTDHVLPSPPWAFEPPTGDSAAAFLTAHNKIVNGLMSAMLTAHSDILDLHYSLREYGLSTLFPLVAECRNVIYAAWTVANVQTATENAGKTSAGYWSDVAKYVADKFDLKVRTGCSDSAFELDPHYCGRDGEFSYVRNPPASPLTDIIVLDISYLPNGSVPCESMKHLLEAANTSIKDVAQDAQCVTKSRFIEQQDQVIGLLIRVCRLADFPNSPLNVSSTIKI